MLCGFALSLSCLILCRRSPTALTAFAVLMPLCLFVSKRAKNRSFYLLCGASAAVAAAMSIGGLSGVLTAVAGVLILSGDKNAPLYFADIAAPVLLIAAAVQCFNISLHFEFSACPACLALAVLAPFAVGNALKNHRRTVWGYLLSLIAFVPFYFGSETINGYAALFVAPLIISACLFSYKYNG